MADNIKPRSHIACKRSATSLSQILGWSQGGCRAVARRSTTACRRLQGRFGRKEVLFAASENYLRPNRSYNGFWWSPTGRPLVGDWSPTSCSGCRQSRHIFYSTTDRRPVAERLPTDLQKVAKFIHSITNAQDTVADRSPIDCRSIPNWSPTDCRLIPDGSPTNVRLYRSIVWTPGH